MAGPAPPRMGDPLGAASLAALAATLPPNEAFGPDSNRPSLALLLEGSDPGLAGWLAQLPCPVIGIGAGPLAGSCDVVLENTEALATIERNIALAPMAAMVLVQLLRATGDLPIEQALTMESLAYATVQKGPELAHWLHKGGGSPRPLLPSSGPPLLMSRDGATLRLTFNRPARRNAMDVEMRDALSEALDLALFDPAIASVELTGQDKCFSIGGDVSEFGQVTDPATAHWIRTLRLPARRLATLGPRCTARIGGAAVGAGTEIAAFAGTIVARPNAWFQLPELKYGLIPGAGGTVSLPRRIGRHRTAYMALSMRRIPASTARAWGLVDRIES
ncbi:MAG: enoyl-CoA hydratase [Bradyrhizobium sp.]|nr:enoyl-CoA hydratase [Bradyrhizobium sp.]